MRSLALLSVLLAACAAAPPDAWWSGVDASCDGQVRATFCMDFQGVSFEAGGLVNASNATIGDDLPGAPDPAARCRELDLVATNPCLAAGATVTIHDDDARTLTLSLDVPPPPGRVLPTGSLSCGGTDGQCVLSGVTVACCGGAAQVTLDARVGPSSGDPGTAAFSGSVSCQGQVPLAAMTVSVAGTSATDPPALYSQVGSPATGATCRQVTPLPE